MGPADASKQPSMIVAAPCPLCQDGQIGFRYCSRTGELVLLCDACGFVWLHPSRLEPEHALDPILPAFLRQHPTCVLRPSRWAGQQEVRDKGWRAYLLRPSDVSNP